PRRPQPRPPPAAPTAQVKGILNEIDVPSVHLGKKHIAPLNKDPLPPFPARTLDTYPLDSARTPLREAVEKSRVVLWALSSAEPPTELRPAVQRVKPQFQAKADPQPLQEQFQAPASGNAE